MKIKIVAGILLLSLSLVILSAPTIVALKSAVYFEGGADNFVFYPGGEWSDTDLFDGFKDVMPGDELTETIVIRNNAAEYDYVKIYLRAENTTETNDFLSKLNLRIFNGNNLISTNTGNLNENILLGKFNNGESTTLKVEISVPTSLSDDYAHQVFDINWIFMAECYKNGEKTDNPVSNNQKPKQIPQNAITFDGIMKSIKLLLVSIAGLILTALLIKRFRNANRE